VSANFDKVRVIDTRGLRQVGKSRLKEAQFTTAKSSAFDQFKQLNHNALLGFGGKPS